MINRLTTADRLNADVRQLVDVMLEKSVTTVRCTKHFLNAAADGPISFELKDEQSAGQLRPLADEATRYRYVVMPMRI